MKKSKDRVLALGETTGHAHRIDTDVWIDETTNTRVFNGGKPLTHEEHKTINIPDGKYRSGIVQEYDYFADIKRDVRD